eukprot:Phypoly_transcript_10086.p1 GENE.Phypoly_transcript_10086~~Phypoly_transcript_10086.p1  ORF type:complete len:370 (+),score=45.50 Phypoly_transcript_10086:139-1248(+)
MTLSLSLIYNIMSTAQLNEIQFSREKNYGIIRGIIKRVSAWIRHFLIAILAQGKIPRHVAFIMDGNRRYAKKHHVENLKGHSAGFKTLEKILDWSMELGIKEVTVYAFSIENFKRPKEEVDGLMDLTTEKFNLIMQENQMIDRFGIRVRVVGDLSLLPEETRNTCEKVVEYSRNNTRATLNVCLAYTARDEITRAMSKIANTAKCACELQRAGRLYMKQEGDEGRLLRLVQGGAAALVEPPEGKDGTWGEQDWEEEGEVQTGKENEKEKSWGWEDELWNAMDLDSAPDLLVRTSGEIRFSDFMLWQTAFSYVVFLTILWPDFSMWQFVYIILLYQANYSTIQAKRKYYVKNVKNRGRATSNSEDTCEET